MAVLPIGTWGPLQGALAFDSADLPGLIWGVAVFGLIAGAALALLVVRGRRRRNGETR
jgi:membrane associated rhomboid family serine protease